MKSGLQASPISQRANVFGELHQISSRSITELIILIEKYEIVSPDLEIFKLAFNVASFDINKSYFPLFQCLLRMLPIEIVDVNGVTQTTNVRTLTQEVSVLIQIDS